MDDACEEDVCGSHGDCRHSPTGYSCRCQEGAFNQYLVPDSACIGECLSQVYPETFSGLENPVADVDECALGFCGEPSWCDNSLFPYSCNCPPGFSYNTSYGSNCTGNVS